MDDDGPVTVGQVEVAGIAVSGVGEVFEEISPPEVETPAEDGRQGSLTLTMRPGGGFVARLVPAKGGAS